MSRRLACQSFSATEHVRLSNSLARLCARLVVLQVLLMTLQEDPPTCDIYKDNTHKFSKAFHELIAKCLQKDPNKRCVSGLDIPHLPLQRLREWN